MTTHAPRASRAHCPHTGLRIGQCDCGFADETSPFFAWLVAAEANDGAAIAHAMARIREAYANPHPIVEEEDGEEAWMGCDTIEEWRD